jgi:2-dehydropantoate 2-reductase
VAVAKDLKESALAYIDNLPAAGTASLQRDIAAGVPSELEALIGVIVRQGRAAGVATPLFSTLYACLLPSERRART